MDEGLAEAYPPLAQVKAYRYDWAGAALEWLEKAVHDRVSALAWVKVYPFYDPLRSDPRFADLLRRMNLGP